MVWYVAIVAVFNLGVGYMLHMYLERSRRLAMYAESIAHEVDSETHTA